MTHELHMRVLGHRVMRYAGITLGCLIASSSINLFLVPAHLLTGGATGIAMIVYYIFGLPTALHGMAIDGEGVHDRYHHRYGDLFVLP